MGKKKPKGGGNGKDKKGKGGGKPKAKRKPNSKVKNNASKEKGSNAGSPKKSNSSPGPKKSNVSGGGGSDDGDAKGGGEKGGKLFPMEKGPTPSKLEPKKITKIIPIGKGKFKTEEDVIKSYNYKLEEKLGEGGFGVVYKATNTKTGIKFACKQCNLGTNMKDSRIQDMKNELFIMEKVKHLYVVKLGAHFMTLNPKGNRLYLFMELADGGDLAKFCNKSGPFTEDKAKLYLAQMVCGINHMHSLGIAHRDIKLQNVLLRKYPQSITGDFLLLVTDFGLSRIIHHNDEGGIAMNKTVCGTPLFMAPEILTRKPYNAFLVDMWAIGVTLFILVTLQIPFKFKNKQQAIKDMIAKKWEWEEDKMKEKPSKQLDSLMKSLLEPNVPKRLTLQKLINHPWMSAAYKKAQVAANKNKGKIE